MLRETAIRDQCDGIWQMYPHKRLQEASILVVKEFGVPNRSIDITVNAQVL